MSVNLVETFATALIELAADRKETEALLGSALVTRELLEENPKLERILASHMLSETDKHEVIDKVFAPVTTHYYSNFLHVVVDKNDFSLFAEINEEFIKLATHALNAKDAFVYSVKPLPEKQLLAIKAFLEKKYAIRVFVHNPVDPTLVGGLRVSMEDVTFDNSVTYQLKQIRERILAGTK